MLSPKMLLTLASSADRTWYIMETFRSVSPGYTTYVAVYIFAKSRLFVAFVLLGLLPQLRLLLWLSVNSA